MSSETGGLSAYSRPQANYGYALGPSSSNTSAPEERATKLNQQLQTRLESQIQTIRQRLQPPLPSTPNVSEPSDEETPSIGKTLDVSA